MLTTLGLLVLLTFALLPVSQAAAEQPTITIVGPPAEPPTKQTEPLFSGTTTDILDTLSLEIFEGTTVGGTPIQTATELLPLTGSWELAPTSELADGTYTAQASQTAGSETGTSEAVTFTVDATPPSIGLSVPSEGAEIADANPALSGAAGNATGDSANVVLKIYSGSAASGSPVQELTIARSGETWTTGSPGPHLADGTYTAQASQSDEAGNTGHSTAHTFTVDTTPPAVGLSTPGENAELNNSNPTLGGAAGNASGDDTNVTLKIYSGPAASGSPVQELTIARSGATWTTGSPGPHLADGTYTAQASQADAAGNSAESAAHTFTVDTTAPAVGLSAPGENAVLNSANPTLSGSAGNTLGDRASITLKIYSGSSASGSPVQELTLTRSGESWSTGAPGPHLSDGTYTAQASQSDEAGNTGHSTAHTFTIDTTGPAVGLTTPSEGAEVNDSTPTLSGAAGHSAGDGASVTLKIYSGSSASGSPVQELTLTRSGTTWTTGSPGPQLEDGTYTAQASQSDEAGNTGHSTAHTFTVDTTGPAVGLSTPTENARSNTSTPTLSGAAGNASGDKAAVTLRIYSGSAVSGSPTKELTLTRTGATWTTGSPGPHLADGTYTAQASQSDTAGNTGHSTAHTFTVDTTPPTVGILTPAENAQLNSANPTLTGTASNNSGDSASVTLKIYAGQTASGTPVQELTLTRSGETWTTGSPGPHLEDGTYTAQASQSDEAGNTRHSATHTFTVDTVAPTVGLSTPAENAQLDGATPTLGGSAGNATGDHTAITLRIYSGSAVSGSPTKELTLTRTGATWTTGSPGPHLADGTYTAQASQSDTAGNTGASAARTFTVDTTAPVVSLGQQATPSNDQTPTFTGAAGTAAGDEQLVKVSIYHGSSAQGTAAATTTGVPSNGSWSASSPSLGEGTYTARAEQSDEAGNTGHSAAVTFTVDTTAPAVGLSTPADAAQLKTADPTISGTAGNASGDQTDVTLKIYSGAAAVGTATQEVTLVRTGTTWTTGSPGPHLADGTYTAQASQSDTAGNTAESAPHTFTIETNAPTVTLSALATPTADATPSFSGSAGTRAGDLPGVTLKIYPGDTPAGTPVQTPVTVTQHGGAWTAGPVSRLPDGTYTAQAEQSDGAGGTGKSLPGVTFTVDTTPPAVTLTSPAEASSTSTGSLMVSGAAGTAAGDSTQITVELFAGTTITAGQSPLESIAVTAADGQWSASVGGLGDGSYTVRAEQSDTVGNDGVSDTRTFNVELPVPSTPAPPAAPTASFTVLPKSPVTGEAVSLISTSTDSSSPLTGFAWDVLGTGPLQPAGPELTTSFATPGSHLVRLQVTAADGLSALATAQVEVSAPHAPLMAPFPIVRIAGSFSSKGALVRLLSVQAPGGARIKVTCRGRHCPIKTLTRIASTSRAGSIKVTFRSFTHTLPPGVVLEIRVSRNGEIGKYTRFEVRRRKLPVRTDTCLDQAGVKPIACPAT